MPFLGEIFARRRRYSDLSVSIQEHLAEKIDELMEEGLSRKDAEFRARREFGNLALLEERSREVWQWTTLESIFADFRFALRQLLKAPGTALLAILTLALGIGANAAMFTVIESVLLQPLPYTHSNRLVFIGPPTEKPGFWSTSWLNFRDIQDQSKLLLDVGCYSGDISVMETRESTQSVVASHITPNLFLMLGVRPILGRTFSDTEGQPGGPNVVLLSEDMWRQTFHENPAIVGQTVTIDGKPYNVVGVMPDSFRFPEAVGPSLHKGVWLPLQPNREMLTNRGYKFFKIVGELRPGVNIAQFQHELNAIAARIRQSGTKNTIAFRATPYQVALTGSVRPAFFVLFGALALVLLIACANVSNLFISRSLSRQQEFALRAALGASRVRLVRQIVSEGLILSLGSCGVGVLLAEAVITAVHKLPPGTIPRADSISIHWTVVLMLAVIAVVATVLSSLLPAVLVARSHPQAALQSATRGISTRSIKGRLGGWIVSVEVALSTLLLVGAGLLAHTLRNLEKSKLGIDTTYLTMFTTMPSDTAGFVNSLMSANEKKAESSVATASYLPVLERVRHMPGVESAALITTPPFSGAGIQANFEIIGQPTSSRDQAADFSAVSGDYARTMGTPILRGRMIEDGDASSAPYVAVINEALTRRFFAGKEPLGKQIYLGGIDHGMKKPYTIVGVLADQVGGKVGGEVQPLILLPQQQIPAASLSYRALLKTVVSFVVKTQGDIPIAAEMRLALHEQAPSLALVQSQTMQQAVEQSTFSQRLGLYLVGSFAGLAVAMVLVGLYGVLSQLVSFRRHEIGVRMALGATRSGVAMFILRQSSTVIAFGLVAGLLLALGMGRWVKSFLYQVQPLDVLTYVAVVVVLAVIGLIATILPAHRAASTEPMQALREE